MSAKTIVSVFAILVVMCGRVFAVAPQIVPMKPIDNLEEGQRLLLHCGLGKGSPPIAFSWRKDGVPVVTNDKLRIVHNDEFQETLQIQELGVGQIGNYTCIAKNAYGSDQMNVAVVLKFKPKWLSEETKTTVIGVHGQNVTLDCRAIGHPAPSIKVFKGRLVARITMPR